MDITLCLLTSRRHNSCFVLTLHISVQHLVKWFRKALQNLDIQGTPMMDSPQVPILTVNVKKILQSISSKKTTGPHIAVITEVLRRHGMRHALSNENIVLT